jgi:Ala-tRNA(Pro) deacylase
MKNSGDLLEFLNSNALPYEMITHEPVFTMAESAKIVDRLPGVRCKNLFLQNKKKTSLFLVVTTAEKTVDLAALAEILGSGRLSLCSRETLASTLGVESGSLSPLALINDNQRRVQLVTDVDLDEEESLCFHPLENTSTVSMARPVFLEFCKKIDHQPTSFAIPHSRF